MAWPRGTGYRPGVSSKPGEADGERASLVMENLDLVEHVLSHLRASGITMDPEELRAYGQQGLVEASLRFEANKGSGFRTFAYLRVRGAMIDGMRKMGSWSRRGYESVQMMRAVQATSEGALDEGGSPEDLSPEAAQARLQKHMGNVVSAMSVGIFAEAAFGDGGITAKDRTPGADELLEARQIIELLNRGIDELPKDEAEVLRRFYLAGECLDDVAAVLGCSRSWASRLHTRAIQRLALKMRASL